MVGVAARPLLSALLLLAALLAGCSGKGPQPSSTILTDVPAEAGKGSVSGVVVDEVIRPLAGINLTMSGQNGTVTTDKDGLFSYTDLEPGIYTIRAMGAVIADRHFLDIQTTAEVRAGETTKVRMVMPIDPAPVGYHSTTQKFDGFYQVSSGFVDEILDLYVFNSTYGPVTTPPSPGCTCRFYFSADINVSTIVADLVWSEPTPGNPAPEFWTMDLHYSNGSAPLYFCEQGSPCSAHFEKAGNFTDADRDFNLGVWTDPSWVYVNQKFVVFVTMFYLDPAPADWHFSDGA